MKISAVLLAGGESRRMGEDKATLSFHGKPLWQVQLDLLRRLEPAEIFLSARSDPPWRPSDVPWVADDPPSRGPLSGLTAALSQMRGTHLLSLAIDMPFMTEKYLRSLCQQVASHAAFLAALSGVEFSLQKIVRELVEIGQLRVLHVTKEQELLFRNLNEPADLGSDGNGDRLPQ